MQANIEISMSEEKIEKETHINPFLQPYNTPHDTVPFDRIRISDYEEAFMELSLIHI